MKFSIDKSFFKRWTKYIRPIMFLLLISYGLYAVPAIRNPMFDTEDWQTGFVYEPKYNNSQWNILFDQHSHTRASDGYLTPEQNILWHISQGFNAMVVSDHNTFLNAEKIREIAREKYDDQIKVLIGIEWTSVPVHLNLIFPPDITREGYSQIKRMPWQVNMNNMQEVIDKTHDLGGVVVVNHVKWSLEVHETYPTRTELMDAGVDYIEVINENYLDNESISFCKDYGLGQITGTDMHYPGLVYSWTLMKTTEFSEQAIFDELLAKRTEILHEPLGSEYPFDHNPRPQWWSVILAPFLGLGELVYGIFRFGWYIFSFIFWINLPFAFIEYRRYKKLQNQSI